MRRLLILLLVLVVPLQAWASAAVPIAASIEHGIALKMLPGGHAAHAHAEEPAGADHHTACWDHAADSYSLECSHLAMHWLTPAPLVRTSAPGTLNQPVSVVRPLGSIVHDVPLPPPLSLI